MKRKSVLVLTVMITFFTKSIFAMKNDDLLKRIYEMEENSKNYRRKTGEFLDDLLVSQGKLEVFVKSICFEQEKSENLIGLCMQHLITYNEKVTDLIIKYNELDDKVELLKGVVRGIIQKISENKSKDDKAT